MKKARIALIIAGIASVLLPLLYVAATGVSFSPVGSKIIMTVSVCMLEASAILKIVDDHRTGRPVTSGVIIAAVFAVVAVTGLIEG